MGQSAIFGSDFDHSLLITVLSSFLGCFMCKAFVAYLGSGRAAPMCREPVLQPTQEEKEGDGHGAVLDGLQAQQLRRCPAQRKNRSNFFSPGVLVALAVVGIVALAVAAAGLLGNVLDTLIHKAENEAAEVVTFEPMDQSAAVLGADFRLPDDLKFPEIENEYAALDGADALAFGDVADVEFAGSAKADSTEEEEDHEEHKGVDDSVPPQRVRAAALGFSFDKTQEAAKDAGETSEKTAAARVPSPRRTRRAQKEGTSVRQDIVTVPLTRQSSGISSKSGSVYHRSAYFGTMSVGVPAQKFTAVFDTGSGQLVLPSGYCRSETCRAHTRYRRSASQSAFDIDYDGTIVQPGDSRDQITVAFGTGEVTGVFVEDVVCLGNNTDQHKAREVLAGRSIQSVNTEGNPRLPKECMPLRFIAATEMSEHPFKSFVFDGVIGLGLDGLSQSPEFNIVEMMSRSIEGYGGSSPSTFGVFLADLPDESSEITFGGYNEQRLDEELHFNPVHDPELGHWLVNIKSIRIDDTTLEFCKEGCKGVVDTGTSLLAVPSLVFPEIFELLKHQAPRSGHCKGPGPELHIELDSYTITLGPKSYARVEEMPARKQSQNARWPRQPANGTRPRRADLRCKPMLMTMDLPEPLGPKLFILGEPVLRKYYTVYNAKAKTVGFGLAHHRSRASQQIQDELLLTDDVDTQEQRSLEPRGMIDAFRIKRALR